MILYQNDISKVCELSTATVDGAVRRCSTILQSKAVDGKKRKVARSDNFVKMFRLGWANIRHIFNIRIMNIFDLLFEYSNIIRSNILCYIL
jgi:hypothetical protein